MKLWRTQTLVTEPTEANEGLPNSLRPRMARMHTDLTGPRCDSLSVEIREIRGPNRGQWPFSSRQRSDGPNETVAQPAGSSQKRTKETKSSRTPYDHGRHGWTRI